jgi:uncharacterized membrane protein
MKTIVGLFENYDAADSALADLLQAGLARDDVSVIARENVIREREVVSGTAEGAAGGAVVGGLAGLLAGMGVLVLPGIGPVLAAGTLAAMLGSAAVGAGVGAAAGGIVGALVDVGVSESEAATYVKGIQNGGVVLAVTPSSTAQARAIRRTFKQHGAVQIKEQAAAVAV